MLGIDVLPSPTPQRVGSIADRAFVRALHGRRAGGAARRHAAQAARGHACAAGLRRHQRHRHAQPARGGRCRRRGAFVFTSTTSTFGRRAGAAGRRAGGVDHRRRGAGAQEHLRRHQGGGRRPVRADAPRPRPAVHRAAHVALLSRGRRRPPRTQRVRRRQPQGERVPVPPRRHRRRGRRASARDPQARPTSASRATSSAPPRRSPATTCASCGTTPPPWCARRVPDYEEPYARRGWAHGAGDRSRLRQRARAPRTRLAAAPRLRQRDRAPACR